MKNIVATFVFFTRLPLWRLSVSNVPAECYKHVVNYWAVVGWLTGAVMSGTLWLSAQILPYSIAVVPAILSRILLTGALHEDGLADFIDGFGGGNNKEKILAIMKDSHIGTYGVIGLTLYFMLFYLLLSNLPLTIACCVILIADPLCKLICSQVTLFVPYARTAQTSKSKTVYSRMSVLAFVVSCIFGLLPLLLIPNIKWLVAILFPLFTFMIMIFLMKKKIGGYTGDCCGAMFLLCELSIYIGIAILIHISFL